MIAEFQFLSACDSYRNYHGQSDRLLIISGCTPEIPSNLHTIYDSYGPIVTSALEALADPHELSSQDDLSVIAPLHPCGQPYDDWLIREGRTPRRASELLPETDIRVLPHCVMGDYWDFGSVDGPSQNEHTLPYVVSFGYAVMVQTYALDILALATRGRMTASRLWRLAMLQESEKGYHSSCLDGIDYGGFILLHGQFPNEFPGFTNGQLADLEHIGDVEVVKERMVHEGFFWLWMAPDRFPVPPKNVEYPTPVSPEIEPDGNRSAIENLPLDVLIPIILSLPLGSLLNLASASRLLRTGILGDDHLACVWIYNNAPWWIPVPTQTPRTSNPVTTAPPTYLASQWSTQTQTTADLPAGLNWAYIRQCVRSGSMLNRRRIWNTALDIERLADLAGV